MNTPQNKFILDIDRSMENVLKDEVGNVIKINNHPLFLSLHFDPLEHVQQRGKIYCSPHKVNILNDNNKPNFYDIKLQEGDTVYFHHFATDESAQMVINEKIYYLQEYEQIYAAERNGVIIPLEEYIFIEPIKETEEDISKLGFLIKPSPEFKVFHGAVKYVNKRSSEKYNICTGDKVIFRSGSEYPMLIKDKVMYRTKCDLVIAKY